MTLIFDMTQERIIGHIVLYCYRQYKYSKRKEIMFMQRKGIIKAIYPYPFK